jgi:hypothetical protein
MSNNLTVYLSTGLGKLADDPACTCWLTARTAMAIVETGGAVTIRVATIEDARALLTAAKAAYAAHEAATVAKAPPPQADREKVRLARANEPLVGGPGIHW